MSDERASSAESEFEDLGIDWSKIDFPTDRVTFGSMRKMNPQHFVTWHQLNKTTFLDTDVGGVRMDEIWLAVHPLQLERGYRQMCQDDEAHFLDNVNKFYVEHGLSGGIAQTRELIRRITHQARQQLEGKTR